MKKLFISLCMLCAGTISFADDFTEIGCPPVDSVFFFTECGIAVEIEDRNYTAQEMDDIISYYTQKLCNQSADGPIE